MSGLKKKINNATRRELGAYIAWFPVTNTFKIGDYGLIEDGVFRPVGSIADEFPDIELRVENGPPSTIDFVSDGTKMTSFGVNAEGNLEPVDSFISLGDAEARLKVEFQNADSCIIKASVESKELKNIHEVAVKLAGKSNWKRRYKVVSATYSGTDCVVICSREAGTEVMLSGNANVLEKVKGGKVDGNVGFTETRNSAFHSIGKTGVIGIQLFKVKWLGSGPNILEGAINPDDIGTEELTGDVEDDF